MLSLPKEMPLPLPKDWGLCLAGACAGAALAWALRQPVAPAQDFLVTQGAVTPTKDGDAVAQLIFERLPVAESAARAAGLSKLLNARRTCRFYSTDKPPLQLVKDVCMAACSAPSGAHCQPWTFAIVESAHLKAQIASVVEAEEQINYDKRMKADWVKELSNLTGATADSRLMTSSGKVQKPYLREAPYVVVLLKQKYGLDKDGNRFEHRYTNESVGIAAGMFVAAAHYANLATLTSTPMGAEAQICKILQRPANEQVFLLLPLGWPAADATVPYRKPVDIRKAERDVLAVY